MNKFIIKKPSWQTSYQRLVNPHRSQQLRVFMISFFVLTALAISGSYLFNKKIQILLAVNDQLIKEQLNDLKDNYSQRLSASDKAAQILLFEGIDLIKKNHMELGLIALEKSVEKDANWRDSALYTGYTYLRLAQEIPNNKSQITNKFQISNLKFQTNNYRLSSDDYWQKAKFYLEKARDIDPLYVKTHQYLSLLYDQLGDQQNSQLSRQKAQEFR